MAGCRPMSHPSADAEATDRGRRQALAVVLAESSPANDALNDQNKARQDDDACEQARRQRTPAQRLAQMPPAADDDRHTEGDEYHPADNGVACCSAGATTHLLIGQVRHRSTISALKRRPSV
jgi:hypothetical protein